MPETLTVAIMMPGDMGHAVGAVLRAANLRVVTNLEGRSRRTQTLAAGAGIEDLKSDSALLDAADILLSILVPDQALDLVERLAPAIRAGAHETVVVDCNAIAPETAKAAGRVIEGAGGRFVDAGIIGPPPRPGASSTRFYASGPEAERFAALRPAGLDVRLVSERVGDASALKMCYAALTKGSAALMTQLLVAAERLGVSAPLRAEFEASQPEQLRRMQHWVPSSVPKAFRWVGEMEEIARTFEAAGVTGKGFEGAASTWRGIAGTDLGRMRVEEWPEADLGFEEVVARLAAELSGSS